MTDIHDQDPRGPARGDCFICGGEMHYEFAVDGRTLRRCSGCGLISLDQARGKDSRARSGEPPPEPGTWRRCGDLLAAYHGPAGKLLLLSDAAPAQFSPGFEVTRQAPDGGPQAGLFDVCLAHDVLPRSADPEKFLLLARDALRDGGTLLLTLPALSQSSAWHTREKWEGLTRDHAHFFSARNLESFLFRHGFRDIFIAEDDPRRDSIAVLARKRPLRAAPSLSIILPVYNEMATFPALYALLKAKRLPGLEKEIVIVESNSTDGTRAAVEALRGEPGVKVVLEDRPRGKGHAVRAGLRHASGDFVLIQDGDLEYDLDDYDFLLEPLLAHREAFVLGSRHSKGWKMRHFTEQPGLAFLMNLGQTVFVFLINLFCGTSMKDPFTMYKVFRRDCLYGLRLESDRFDLDWEIVIKFIRKGYIPLELPVNYSSRSFGEGKKISFFLDPLTWIVALFRFRFCRLYPEPLGGRPEA